MTACPYLESFLEEALSVEEDAELDLFAGGDFLLGAFESPPGLVPDAPLSCEPFAGPGFEPAEPFFA